MVMNDISNQKCLTIIEMIQILQVQLLNIFSKLKDLFSPILVFDGVDKKHPNLVRELNSRLENLFWIMHPTT